MTLRMFKTGKNNNNNNKNVDLILILQLPASLGHSPDTDSEVTVITETVLPDTVTVK